MTIAADLDDPYTFNVITHHTMTQDRGDIATHVHGPLLQLPSDPHVGLWVNRAGFAAKLNANPLGQIVWEHHGGPARTGVADWKDELVGNLVICGPTLVDGTIGGLTPSQIRYIQHVIDGTEEARHV